MADPVEIVVAGHEPDKLREYNRIVHSRFIPNKVVVGSINGDNLQLPLLEGRQEADQLTYYFCLNRACHLPVTDKSGLNEELDRITAQAR